VESSKSSSWRHGFSCEVWADSYDFLQTPPPGFERLPLFPVVGMTVVDGGDAGLDVVQDPGDDEARDPDRGHVRRRRSAEVVASELDSRAAADALHRLLDSGARPETARVREQPWRLADDEAPGLEERDCRRG